MLLSLAPTAPCSLLSSLLQTVPDSLGDECGDQKLGPLLSEMEVTLSDVPTDTIFFFLKGLIFFSRHFSTFISPPLTFPNVE